MNEQTETKNGGEPVKHHWVGMTVAAAKYGVSLTKLSNMVRLGEIQGKHNPRDKRSVLVDTTELDEFFTAK